MGRGDAPKTSTTSVPQLSPVDCPRRPSFQESTTVSDNAVTMSSSQTTAPDIATSEVHERPAATGASLYAFCTMSCSPLTFSSKGAATSTPGQRSVYAQRFQRPSGLSQQFSMVWRQLSVPGPH